MFRFLLIAAVLASPLPAQESTESDVPDWIQATNEQPETTPDWVRPGERAPEFEPLQDQTVLALRGRAFSLERESKTAVLKAVGELYDQGRISPYDSAAVEVVAFLATEMYDFRVVQLGRPVNDFPIVRAEAVRLLGSIGGPVAASALERVLRQEEDLYVLSEAVRAVGFAADEPTTELIDLLTELTERMESLQRPDNALAMSILGTVDRLQSIDRPIDDPDLFRALILIAQGSYSNSVRREALRLVNKLRRKEQ